MLLLKYLSIVFLLIVPSCYAIAIDYTVGGGSGLFAQHENLDMVIGHILLFKYPTEGPLSQEGQTQLAENLYAFLTKMIGKSWAVSTDVSGIKDNLSNYPTYNYEGIAYDNSTSAISFAEITLIYQTTPLRYGHVRVSGATSPSGRH